MAGPCTGRHAGMVGPQQHGQLFQHTSPCGTSRAAAVSGDPWLGPSRVPAVGPAQPAPPDLAGDSWSRWCSPDPHHHAGAAQPARAACASAGPVAGMSGDGWGSAGHGGAGRSGDSLLASAPCAAVPPHPSLTRVHGPRAAPQPSTALPVPHSPLQCHNTAPSHGAGLGTGMLPGRAGGSSLAPRCTAAGWGHTGGPTGLSDGTGAAALGGHASSCRTRGGPIHRPASDGLAAHGAGGIDGLWRVTGIINPSEAAGPRRPEVN